MNCAMKPVTTAKVNHGHQPLIASVHHHRPYSLQYWCYHCNKQVSIETSADLPDIICHACKNGFVESIDPHQPPSLSGASDPVDDPVLGNQFLPVLRLIAQAARDGDAPPPPPSEHADPSDDDYLRIEFDGWLKFWD